MLLEAMTQIYDLDCIRALHSLGKNKKENHKKFKLKCKKKSEKGGRGEKIKRSFVPVYNQESDSTAAPQECSATSFSIEAYARRIVIRMKGEGKAN